MRKGIPILLAVLICAFIFTAFSQDITYTGAGKCKICHKSEKRGQQYPLWEARQHSKAFAALSTDKAKELSPDTAAAENPKCLKCHGPVEGFKEEGVTCEACHGAGSAYKKLSIMKDHAQSVANGMTVFKSEDDIKKQCDSCHANAHDSTFDFATAWEKVKHPVPEEE